MNSLDYESTPRLIEIRDRLDALTLELSDSKTDPKLIMREKLALFDEAAAIRKGAK